MTAIPETSTLTQRTGSQIGRIGAWLRRRDPGLAATRRAARTALVMPALFAFCAQVLHSPVTGTYAAFGAFSMLLLVDFSGPIVQRLRAHAALGVAWLVLVTLGTLAARSVWSAAAATVVIGFVVLFSGVVSSVLAGATTALLLGFVLPVSASAPLSQLPDRLIGVLMATVCATAAASLLWPRTPAHPLAAPAAEACRAAAGQLRADAKHFAGGSDGQTFPHCVRSAQKAETSAQRLRQVFVATPYRPTGLSTGSRALVRLVDELTWLGRILAEAGPAAQTAVPCDPSSCAVREAAATVLDLAADLLEHPGPNAARLREAADDLRKALNALEDEAVRRLPAPADLADGDAGLDAFIGSLDVSFRAQEIAFAVLQIARNVDTARPADQRSWLGPPARPRAGLADRARWPQRPASAPAPTWSATRSGCTTACAARSGWASALLLADLTGVQHAFWVVLGTLSVLRSNALNTGQNALRRRGRHRGRLGRRRRAAAADRHGHAPLLWFLLPVAILLAGHRAGRDLVRRRAGRLHGDAGDPVQHRASRPVAHRAAAGSRTSRSAARSASVVGLFFWPRGAAAAVGKALAEAYTDSARYLAGAVDYGVCRLRRTGPAAGPPRPQAARRRRQRPGGWTTPSGATWPRRAPSRSRWRR